MSTFTEEDVLSAFTTREYMLTDDGKIRTSEQLNELYHSKYMSTYAEKYKKFKGFQTFNPSFNHEILGTTFDPATNTTTDEVYLLDENGRVPQYVQEIKEQATSYETQLLSAIEMC